MPATLEGDLVAWDRGDPHLGHAVVTEDHLAIGIDDRAAGHDVGGVARSRGEPVLARHPEAPVDSGEGAPGCELAGADRAAVAEHLGHRVIGHVGRGERR
ncbi:MAG: hypothetical protein OSA99_19235 [Acidimicrobiales bacterium]|nr:hypothetical protein [Acidimicrobiales bacterium]